jgi:hypothetical protein
LFIPGILFVDDVQLAVAPDDLAIRAAFFNGSSYFHLTCSFYLFALLAQRGYYLYLKMMRPLVKS